MTPNALEPCIHYRGVEAISAFVLLQVLGLNRQELVSQSAVSSSRSGKIRPCTTTLLCECPLMKRFARLRVVDGIPSGMHECWIGL